MSFQGGLVGTNLLHALTVGVVLFSVTVPLVLRIAFREQRPWLVPLLLGSLGLHFLGSFLQILVVRLYYDNSADFHLYNGAGRDLLAAWSSGDLVVPHHDIPGTGAVILITALVYAVAGVDQLGGFFVFSWFSFLGLIAFYRAFRVALPQAFGTRYAVILFLLPSLWYWPTVSGKEALMMPALGLMALGCAHLTKGVYRGAVPLLLGSVLGCLIRPHEVAMVYGAFGVAVLVRRGRRTLAAPVARVAIALMICSVGVALAIFTARYLGITSLSSQAVVTAVNNANENSQGIGAGYGSSHSEWNISPLYYPYDVVLVLFKPLPWEVTSFSQATAALENLSLLGLFALSWRSLLAVPGMLRGSPYVTLCLVYSVGFTYLFSALANVGLLVRERTLLFPFLLVLLCLRPWGTPRAAERARPELGASVRGR